jgi:hypothetical protein
VSPLLRAFVASSILLVGCAQFDTGSVAQRSAAGLLDCPQSEVSMTQVGAYRYRGEGCGGTVSVACTSAALEPRCLREGDSAGGEDEPALDEGDADGDAETEEAEETEPVVAETPDASVEAQIRAGLDARREDILECVGRERVAIRAGYAPDGSVALSLQGDRAGTAEERCVVDALDGVRVAATGEAGVVVHLIR